MIGARGNPMPKKKRRDTPEKQSQRFVETARKLGVDERGSAFEMAFKAIAVKQKKRRR